MGLNPSGELMEPMQNTHPLWSSSGGGQGCSDVYTPDPTGKCRGLLWEMEWVAHGLLALLTFLLVTEWAPVVRRWAPQ